MIACDMARTRYTEAQKTEAIALAVEHGPAEAARRLGGEITAGTIRTWCHRAGVATATAEKMAEAREAHIARREVAREKLRTLLIETSLTLVERIDAAENARDVQPLAISAGILLDKFRLESGEATGRTEHTGKDAAHVIADELAERRRKSAAA